MKIAVLGARGRLGAAIVRKWSDRHEVRGFARPELDLLQPRTIDKCLEEPFDWVVNCAAYTNVDGAEKQPEEARLANTVAARRIAECCAKTGARLIHTSTDYVFDGRQDEPYDEDAPPSPLGIYGRSKADGEFDVLAALPEAIVTRVSWVFGPDKPSFVDMMLSRALGSEKVAAVADKWSTPSYTDDLADWIEALMAADAPGGVYHLCNGGSCTWRDYAEHALQCAAAQGIPVKTTKVAPLALGDMEAFVAERPVNTVLSTGKFTTLLKIEPRSWQDAVRDYIATHPPC